MSAGYRAVGWNRQKRRYDAIALAGVGACLATFAAASLAAHPPITAETILIRGLGTAAFALLHLVLAIGPLARLDRRFLPLLYNRRHLGVLTFALGLAHGALATVQFHALGDENPLVSLLSANRRAGSLAAFPFELFGVAALLVLFLMAATSHDFWLAALTPPAWKRLHMAVYAAYAALVLHVALGALQSERSPALAGALALGLGTLCALHLLAGWRERDGDRDAAVGADGWVDAGPVAAIPENRAIVRLVAGERVAVFRHAGGLSALSAVCAHQNGPLGEGRILDGCVTCPWHGYQYVPETGASPPPFSERVPTFRLRVARGRVLVDPRPLPAGTRVPATPLGVEEAAS